MMNKKQKVVIVVGMVVIMGMCAFPPQGSHSEYHLIWSGEGKVDATRVALQVIVVGAFTTGGVMALKGFKMPRRKWQRIAVIAITVLLALAITGAITAGVLDYQSRVRIQREEDEKEEARRRRARAIRGYGRSRGI